MIVICQGFNLPNPSLILPTKTLFFYSNTQWSITHRPSHSRLYGVIDNRPIPDGGGDADEDASAEMFETFSELGLEGSVIDNRPINDDGGSGSNPYNNPYLNKLPLPLRNQGIPIDEDSSSDEGSDYEVAFDDEWVHEESTRLRKTNFALFKCNEEFCDREQVDDMQIKYKGSAASQVMLIWNEPPRSCLVLLKHNDPALRPAFVRAVKYLLEEKGLAVFAEDYVAEDLQKTEKLPLRPFARGQPVDFAVTMGGDGLLMYANSLFPEAAPPVLCFNMGSLGFLTPFSYQDFKSEVDTLMLGHVMLSLRMRLQCAIHRAGAVVAQYNVLNEVVIDRGSSPYLSNIEAFCDNLHLTTVQADGIIIATPTGSTAYSMSAGGSIMHPSVPAILFTPICPHSLSFRPVIFPDSAVLRCEVNPGARHGASVAFDGKRGSMLEPGDALEVRMSFYPVPTVCKQDHTRDWFVSLDRGLNFNQRQKQKPLDEDLKNQKGKFWL